MEEKLKKEGKWEEYENSIINNEIDNKIVDFKEYIKERLKESNDNFVSEDGDVESWVGDINEDRVNDYVDEVVEYLKSMKK
jgi:CHASE3 domain sensor protein